MKNDTPNFRTSLAISDESSITVLGKNMATELLGKIAFGELAFWLMRLRRPSPNELRLFEAVLLATAEHGLTTSSISARLTYHSAPEALQGALAAGILNGGSRFLGVTENVARMLANAVEQLQAHPQSDEGWDEVARAVISAYPKGEPIPGIGHPMFKNGDPRVPVLIRIAQEEGLTGPHLALLLGIARVLKEKLGRELPLNGAGVNGAILADMGFPVKIVRGISLLARTAGLLGHLAEEQRNPIANDIYRSIEDRVDYTPPPA